MTQTIMPIVIPVHTTTIKEVNCIIEQGVRYCEKPLRSDLSSGMFLSIIILTFFWMFGLIYTVHICIEENRSPIWVGLYILATLVILFYSF